ncbi:hypothetical protein [Glutamicibacter nicotianae]|uniref:Phosphatidic acid phosphatase type 2/haloperoxidase domain-containing protein n=2 Tax=Glutamicibacter nicotianae TaxID=37929 RepID=A0ABQ0RPV8_GLUNI|nr:hypothetical protein [Glutamicibacter nicotianae]GEC13545.1 hypothetical protein ANI01nite_27480 [Glutamicibacter nicotianae]
MTRMQQTSQANAPTTERKFALVVSHLLSPIILATVLLLATPWRDASVRFSESVTAALFTTIIPWLILAGAKLRGKVTDMHVTVRHQRHWIYAYTAGLILCGLLVLRLMDAGTRMYLEVLSILLGLAVVAVINMWWKVSVHLAVGTYVILQVAGQLNELMPLVVFFIAVLSWARIRSFQHTATQVCGGVAVGIAIHYAHEWMAAVLL